MTLYDDAMILKKANNSMIDENIKLKTNLHKLEAEWNRKEKLLEEIVMNQNNIGKTQISKIKAESHVSSAMKKHIREIKQEVLIKDEEISRLKKNIRITRFQELEMEIKMYMNEWNRLKGLTREIIRSKDPLSDPNQKMEIEKRFEEQNQIIEQLKSDNNQLENAFHERQIEIMNLQEQINDSNSPQNQQK